MKNIRLNPERIYRAIASVVIRLIYNTQFIGFEKIPRTGPAIIIANHVSYMDGVVIQAACNRPIRFLIDHYIYKLPAINYFMRYNRAIPILAKKDSVEKALDEISSGLDSGDLVGIFPEGQLTYTGSLGRFKPGIEWIVERDPVPVYPVVIIGMWDSMFSRKYRKSKTRWIPKNFRRRVIAVCGDPIPPSSIQISYLQRIFLGMLVALEKEHYSE